MKEQGQPLSAEHAILSNLVNSCPGALLVVVDHIFIKNSAQLLQMGELWKIPYLGIVYGFVQPDGWVDAATL